MSTDSDPRNLIVNYIPTPVTSEELRQLFEQYGPVESARIIVDRANNNHPKGYGFVKFKTEAAAREATAGMNGFEIHNKRLRVTPARGPQQRGAAQKTNAAKMSLHADGFSLPVSGMGAIGLTPSFALLEHHAPFAPIVQTVFLPTFGAVQSAEAIQSAPPTYEVSTAASFSPQRGGRSKVVAFGQL